VLTVATDKTDGFLRYLTSAESFKIKPQVLGLNEKLREDGQEFVYSGKYKLNLLKDALKEYENDQTKIVLYTDSYDVLFLGPIQEIVNEFKRSRAKVLFSADYNCHPEEQLAVQYPTLNGDGAPYLNSAVFIGYATNIYKILNHRPIEEGENSQLFFTKAYLDEDLRNENIIKLDHYSNVFQTLNGGLEHVRLELDESNEYQLLNDKFNTSPLILIGNGPAKLALNQYGNYLSSTFKQDECRIGNDQPIPMKLAASYQIYVALYIEKPTPFLEEFFEKILAINYPKERIDLFIHNNAEFHSNDAEKFYTEATSQGYSSVYFLNAKHGTTEEDARKSALNYFKESKCEFMFSVDSDAHIDNPDTLQQLVMLNKTIIAPIILRFNSNWANFWGAIDANGYYDRSADYIQIVDGDFRGVWNVPFINTVYLMKRSLIPKVSYKREGVDIDMAFCQNLREQNVFMYATNFHYYGHFINTETYDIQKTHPDVYEYFSNKYDWAKKYIHSDYWLNLEENYENAQPCQDVFWFPLFTEKFADSLVDIMEAYGKWSDGSNEDNRLAGGYEAVPTRDIHMNQVGLEETWLKLLEEYVRPLQLKVFPGYFDNPPRSIMNFVVRYRPDEQPNLKPHNDASTYTINIALNHANIDYQGGGCRFIRYNCAVTDTRKGWLLMFPGRFTHYHEGLTVTNGTRYIMVSFVDP
jgi:procollagen-lysine,2-oxoglutarate 5-dioxygenase